MLTLARSVGRLILQNGLKAFHGSPARLRALPRRLLSRTSQRIEHTMHSDVSQIAQRSSTMRQAVLLSCSALLIAGSFGIAAALNVGERSAYAAILLNAVAAILLVSIITMIISALAWRVLKQPRGRDWMATASMISLCALLSLAGLGAGASSLRLESALRLQVGADFVFIGGAMPRDLAERLEELVHPGLSLQSVVLSNSGGSIEAALETAAWLEQRGVRRAIVEGDCASACAVLALLLPERYLAPGAALGFHALWGRNRHSSELQADQALVLARFERNGIDAAFVETLLVGSDMNYPDRSQLLATGLISGCWSHSERAPMPCGDPELSS